MKIEHRPGAPDRLDTPLLALAAFEGDAPSQEILDLLPGERAQVLERAWRDDEFRGRTDTSILLHAGGDDEGPRRYLVLGAGSREKADGETIRRLGGRAVRKAEAFRLGSVALHLPNVQGLDDEAAAQAGAEGLALAAWRFEELQAEDDERPRRPVEAAVVTGRGNQGDEERGVRAGTATARAENLARTLQSRPGNVATPSHLAEVAEALASDSSLEATILGPEEMEAEGMGALLGVSRGSAEEPRFIVLEHKGGEASDPPVALVGKGLTFDSGGISIKPSGGMEDMKYDMSGGAAVLAAMQGVAELEVPVNVLGVVPASENLPSGTALKPGDVIRTRAGKTVEVINTDAEGRLILADALSWVRDRKPSAVLDCATLTGSCVVALGHHAAAVLGSDDDLVQEVRDAGDRAGERCWPLPLWDVYRRQLDSKVADIKNVGGRPAGTITAAHFLKEFVGDVPWAHLDIAGTAYGEGKLPYRRDGGFGFPTRLLLEWVRGRAP